MQHSYLLSIDFKITSLTDWIVQLKIYPLSLSAKLEKKCIMMVLKFRKQESSYDDRWQATNMAVPVNPHVLIQSTKEPSIWL